MAPRLEIIEEQRIDYEVPFITDRGEVLDSSTVQINERRGGVNISYVLVTPSSQELERLFPSEGVDYLAGMTKQILQDLEMNPQRVILQLWEYSPVNDLYSVEGRAPVSKQRDAVMIILTKTPFIYKFGYELVLWHQAMHAKDRFERRFPSAHPMVEAGEWLDALWHFSVDGRLQKMGKPYYSKEERLEEASKILGGLCQIDNLPDRVNAICGELWGREVTFDQLLGIGKELGLEIPLLGPLENSKT